MSTYAIGDIQGCYVELLDLLNEVNFDDSKDRIWFVGDIVNRGPMSLDCLEFALSLGDRASTVLGNHELHLLAVANQTRKTHKKDTLQEIVTDPNADQLLQWVKRQKLMEHDEETGFTMVHAGLPPQWTLAEARERANETEALIRSTGFTDFLDNMYGDQPDAWTESLTGDDRHRYIINCLTRTRYVTDDGRLNMKEKGPPGTQSASLVPWYAHPERFTKNDKIIFGHWSTVTIGSETDFKQYNVYPLDTGCLWGGKLTALRLEDEQLFSVPSRQPKVHK